MFAAKLTFDILELPFFLLLIISHFPNILYLDIC